MMSGSGGGGSGGRWSKVSTTPCIEKVKNKLLVLCSNNVAIIAKETRGRLTLSTDWNYPIIGIWGREMRIERYLRCEIMQFDILRLEE